MIILLLAVGLISSCGIQTNADLSKDKSEPSVQTDANVVTDKSLNQSPDSSEVGAVKQSEATDVTEQSTADSLGLHYLSSETILGDQKTIDLTDRFHADSSDLQVFVRDADHLVFVYQYPNKSQIQVEILDYQLSNETFELMQTETVDWSEQPMPIVSSVDFIKIEPTGFAVSVAGQIYHFDQNKLINQYSVANSDKNTKVFLSLNLDYYCSSKESELSQRPYQLQLPKRGRSLRNLKPMICYFPQRVIR